MCSFLCPGQLVKIALDMLPILILIGVWIWFMRRMQGPNSLAAKQRQYLVDALEEQRRTNQALERIAAALEQRDPTASH